ncbi:TonB-dependent receptor [Salinicola tamaricis]|uniref:TonB-dependent receptor n=1 Tax=Salinicola tamaricis TaxID=1771309 RepID=UPI0013EBE8C4|nr:TonB-dependent receptor [Salinicola tamaricis]
MTDDNGNASVNDFETGNHIDNFASQAGVRGYVLTGPVSHDVTLAYSSAYRKFDSDWSFLAAGTTNIYDPQDLSRPQGDPSVGGSVTRTRSQGVTLSDTLGFLNDRVLLTLGARYQELEVDERPNAGGNNRYADRRVTPAVGVVFKATSNVSLYANYVEALQDGGTVTDNTASNYGEYLGIAHAKQYEVGSKFDYGDIGGGISLFQIELPTAAVVDGVGSLDNEQRNRGVELSLYGEPLEGLRLFSSATWIDAELTKTQDGTRVTMRPGCPSTVSCWAASGMSRMSTALTATGRVIHTGTQYADASNDLELDPWTRLDLGVRYTTPIGGADWVWRAGIDNVTDEDYWAGASTAFAGYLIQGEPRTLKLSATVEF